MFIRVSFHNTQRLHIWDQRLYRSAAKSIPSPHPCLLIPQIIRCYCDIFLKSDQFPGRSEREMCPVWGWGTVPGAEQRILCSSFAAGLI